MLTIFFATVSLLYATVGQAGGTAFLALMAFSSFPSTQTRPTALLLNIVAATYSTWLFNRGAYVDWKKLKPLVIASVPTALIGGFTVLSPRVYNAITGVVLLIAAAVLLLGRAKKDVSDCDAPLLGTMATGAGVGFVSGVTGVGGGVFLAPILIALRWASPKQAAALSAPFIWVNSAIGLVGAVYVGQLPSPQTWQYALGALVGAMIGTTVGLRWLSEKTTRYVLVVILGAAAIQLIAFPTR